MNIDYGIDNNELYIEIGIEPSVNGTELRCKLCPAYSLNGQRNLAFTTVTNAGLLLSCNGLGQPLGTNTTLVLSRTVEIGQVVDLEFPVLNCDINMRAEADHVLFQSPTLKYFAKVVLPEQKRYHAQFKAK